MFVPDESSYTPAPEGMHRAICYLFVDYGTQQSEMYGPSHRIRLGWELSDEERENRDGVVQPLITSAFYSWSMNEKSKLRLHLESWRGRKFTSDQLRGDGADRFDIRNILGQACMLNIVHEEKNGNLRDVIKAITPLPKAVDKPRQVRDTVYLALVSDEYDAHTFENLPEKVRDQIKQSPEWRALNGLGPKSNGGAASAGSRGGSGGSLAEELNDDIPF